MHASKRDRQSVSGKSIFLHHKGSKTNIQTPIDHRSSALPETMRSASPRTVSRNQSTRISKTRNGDRGGRDAHNLVEQFTTSLEEYREDVREKATSDVTEAEHGLNVTLKQLKTDIEARFADLGAVEEPLGRPFHEEALVRHTVDGGQEIVQLKDEITEFRQLLEEKRIVLDRLWSDWEATQIELIRLAVEVFGQESVHIVQHGKDTGGVLSENMEEIIEAAQRVHEEHDNGTTEFDEDLEAMGKKVERVSTSMKATVTDMEQQSKKDKGKNIKMLLERLDQVADM